MDSLSRIETHVSRLNATMRTHQEIEILEWLTPIDYGRQQSDYIKRRQAGTGQWLLESAEYQGWLEGSKALFCPGIPGAGKTFITATVIDDLCSKFQKDSDIGIAYLYCNFKRNHEQKLEDLLLSLLKQLAQGQSLMPNTVKLLYDQHKDQRTRPSLDEISKALYSTINLYSRAFIIVDALDECQSYDRCRIRFISKICSLQTNTGANIFATSRFISEIEQEFGGSMSLEIRASDEDIQRYLDGHMSLLPKCVSRSPDLQKKIKAEVSKAIDGMYVLSYAAQWSGPC